INVLQGDEYELHRQLGEINHLEEYLKYQQQGDATQFLFSWSRHTAYRSALHDFKFFKNSIDVELDVKVVGAISVCVDDHQGKSGGGGGGGVGGVAKAVKQTVGGGQMMGGGGAGVNAGMVGMGVPRKIQTDRRVQRRTSVSFNRALDMFLAALDSVSAVADF
ncbi:hypothetical protein HDU98_010054, partial [Podochytrium sp. JEL0797]